MEQHLAIVTLSSDEGGVVKRLTRTISDCDCNLVECRVSVLGNRLASHCLVRGGWHSVARLENELPRLAEREGMEIISRRCDPQDAREDLLPYAIDLVCQDRSGVVAALVDFCEARGIQVSDLSARAYAATRTGARMSSLQLELGVPAELHIATLREEFMELCDRMNLDAVLEPTKE